MKGQIFQPLEFEIFNPVEFNGVRIQAGLGNMRDRLKRLNQIAIRQMRTLMDGEGLRRIGASEGGGG